MVNYRWVITVTALGLGCFLTRHSPAQQAPIRTPGVVQINVNLVQVDAVVTDDNGNPVTNLKAEDFELRQDGKLQSISSLEFVRVRDPLASMVVRPSTMPVSPGRAVPPPPALTLRPDQVRRTIAIVVDDIGYSFTSMVYTREALKKWVDNEMQPGDLVSIVRTNAAMGAMQQFTNDKRLLYSAIERLKYQPGRIGVESFAPFAGLTGIDTGEFEAGLGHIYLMGSVNAIRYVMQGLRDLPGRKSLILFAEDMNLGKLDSQRLDIEERLRQLADEANRASVVIHSIDPRGVVFTGITASDNLSGREGPAIAGLMSQRASSYISSQDGMVLLAQRTGGVFLVNNDFAGSLRRAINDGDGYYLLGYQPAEDTFAPKADPAKYHSISVRVNRPGLKVRSRTGFFAVTDAPRAAPQTRQGQIAKALVSPFSTPDLRVRLTTLFSNSDADGSYLKVMLHFDARDLEFTEEPDGSRKAAIDIALVMFDENGNPRETVDKTWSLQIQKEAFDEVLRKGLVYSAPVPVKKPGPYQLRVALRDTTAQKLGSAMQFVDVPDVKSGRLALSGIVVTAEPRDPNDPEGTPAVRIFKAGGTFSYAYEILNIDSSRAAKGQLRTQVRLYRDGEVVYATNPSPINAINADARNTKRMAVGGQITLTKIPPGDYVMQVLVADTLKENKNRLAVQTIDFEVRP